MKARARSLLTTLILLAAAAVALLAGWFGIARRDESKEARRSADARLLPFEPRDVTGVTVTAKGEVTRIVRSGEGWRIESPVRAAADQAVVDSLIDRVATLRRTAAVPSDPSGASRYGLAKPHSTVALALKDGKTASLALGDENSFDGTIFATTGASDVALVPGDVKWTIERTTFELRDKSVLHLDQEAVKTLRIRRPPLEFEVRRETAPGRLSSYLWALAGLRAKAFVDETGKQEADLGLGHPALVLTLLGKDGGQLGRLAASAPRGGVRYVQASGEPRIAEIDASALDALPKTPAEAEEKPAPQPSTPSTSSGSGATGAK